MTEISARTLLAFTLGNALAQKLLYETITNWSHL
jgi:hypothetical protein